MKNQIELRKTADGSHTLFVPELNESYHSDFGAYTESLHIFIGAGLEHTFSRHSGTIGVLEVGMGTGLNVLLSLEAARQSGRSVRYTALEPLPPDESILCQMNYAEGKPPQTAADFHSIHKASWEKEEMISPGFSLHKQRVRLEDFDSGEKFHLCFFDAFSPAVQPALWGRNIFRKIFGLLLPGGVFVTYSCKGEVRRSLGECGFVTERLAGPPGKREFLRARK